MCVFSYGAFFSAKHNANINMHLRIFAGKRVGNPLFLSFFFSFVNFHPPKTFWIENKQGL